MELLDIYNNIQNPINDPDIINQMINISGDDSRFGFNFYDKMINQKKHGKAIINKDELLQDLFEVGTFRKWRSEVLSMTKEEINEFIKFGVYGEDFYKLRSYLKNIPEVRTMDDYNNIRYSHEVTKEIKALFDKYYWTVYNDSNSWIHVSSNNIYAKKKPEIQTEHELFLNVDSTVIHRLAMELITKCEELKIPYHFKMNTTCLRDDDFVVFTDTKHLHLFIEILETILLENPDLERSFHEPPILTGKINNWLGYGTSSEYKAEKDYMSKRVDCVESAINKTARDWVKDNIIKMIFFRDQYVHFYEYIAKSMVQDKIAELKSRYELHDDSSRLDKRGYDPDYALNKTGVKKTDLDFPQFFDYLYNQLIENMESRIISYIEDPNYTFEVKIDTRNDNKIVFNQFDLDKTLCKIAPKIRDNDPEFVDKVREGIDAECKAYGFDKSKFCFDVNMVYKFISEDGKSVMKEVPYKEAERRNVPRPKKIKIPDPIRIVKKRNMVVSTNYVPSQKMTAELQDLIDNHTEKVLPYMHRHMSAVRILLPYLVEHHSRLADMFVDDVIIKYPEVQGIYESALEKNERRRGL